MRSELMAATGLLYNAAPEAYAFLYGSTAYPRLSGAAYLYPIWGGTLLMIEASGLPQDAGKCRERIFGLHIHEGSKCEGTAADPFADAGLHYNPAFCPHPEHAGDLPPLFGCRGYALSIFFTDRFRPEEVVGRTIIIHDMPDDFRSQPSGDSGEKIACGEIRSNLP